MNNKNVWQHNKLVPMDKKKKHQWVCFQTVKMGPLNFPPQCGRKMERTPKKEGVEKGKREDLGKVTHQETNWKKGIFT